MAFGSPLWPPFQKEALNLVQSPDHKCADSGPGCLLSASRNETLGGTLAGSLIHFLVRKIEGMTLNFGLYRHTQVMVCQLLVVQLNFCLNYCHLFANQGYTSSFFKNVLKHPKNIQ